MNYVITAEQRGQLMTDLAKAYISSEALVMLGSLTPVDAEPIAYLSPRMLDAYARPDLGYETCGKSDYNSFPVYERPAPLRELSDEEIYTLTTHHLRYQIEDTYVSGVFDFARAVIKAAKETK